MFPRISIVIFIEINRSLISCILHKNVMKTVNLSILLWVNVGYILLCFDVLLFTVNFEKVSWCILVYIWNAIKIWSLYLQYWCPRYPFRLFTLNIHQVAHFCLYKIFNSTFTKSIVTQSLQNFYIDWRNCFVLMFIRPIIFLYKILRYDVTEKGNQWIKRMCYRSKYGGKYMLTIYVALCAIGSSKKRERKNWNCAAGIITYYTCMCFIIPPCREKYVISCRGSFLCSTISYQVSRTGWNF